MIHLTYGGSTAKRSKNCPGWVAASEGIPRRPAGHAARMGSLHHEVQEICRKTGTVPADHIGLVYTEDGETLVFTEDELELSETAYAAVDEMLDLYEMDDLVVEPFVQLVPGKVGGSVDLLGVNTAKNTVLINDYKFGSHRVDATGNDQHFLYAASAIADPQTSKYFDNDTKIVFAITQPKARREAYMWETDVGAVMAYKAQFLAAIETDIVRSGEHCKFCPAEAFCQVRKQTIFADNLLGKDLRENLQRAADMVEAAEAWVKAVHEEVFMQMSRGVPIAGWKLVERDKHLAWVDKDAAADYMIGKRLPKRDIFKTTIITPTQAKKLIKQRGNKVDLTNHVVKPKGESTSAPHSDPRPGIELGENPDNLTALVSKSS